MSEVARVSAHRLKRRSHAERTAETRTRILEAVVESISKVGFHNTTAAEIVSRAGVTWGAVQHHFGGKQGILMAVLETSFGHFAEFLEPVEADERPLEERVDLFIDRAWEHFGSPEYRSTFEILLNHAGPDGPAGESLWQSEMFEAWHRIWARIFADVTLPRRRTVLLEHYTISVLAGLAATQMLGAKALRRNSGQLQLLKQTLRRELGGCGEA